VRIIESEVAEKLVYFGLAQPLWYMGHAVLQEIVLQEIVLQEIVLHRTSEVLFIGC